MSNLNGLLSPFQTRFKDRLSLIGKDGVNGLLKQTLVPIEPLNAFGYWNKINKSYNPKTIIKDRISNIPKLPYLYNYNSNSNIQNEKPSFSTFNQNKPFTNNFQSIPINKLNFSLNLNRQIPKKIEINDNSYLNKKPVENNDTSLSYIPYNLQDYKKINRNFEVGKLGPNLFTDSWKSKFQKNKVIKMYSANVKEDNNFLINYKKSNQQQYTENDTKAQSFSRRQPSRLVSRQTSRLISRQPSRSVSRQTSRSVSRQTSRSVSRQKQLNYGKRVENLRIGVNLTPYIVYNNKRKNEKLKKLLRKTNEKYYQPEINEKEQLKLFSNSIPHSYKISPEKRELQKGNIRDNIIKKFKGNII